MIENLAYGVWGETDPGQMIQRIERPQPLFIVLFVIKF